jgi:thioesterase domain-containing protein
VAVLVLIDPTSQRSTTLWSTFNSSPSQVGVKRFRELRLWDSIAYVRTGLKCRFVAITSWFKMLVCRAFLTVRRRVPIGLRVFYFIERARLAGRRYTPGVYCGRVIILPTWKAANNCFSDWNQLVTGRLEIYEMPGNHLDAIHGSHVNAWAERLKACLQNITTPRDPSGPDFDLSDSSSIK